MSTMEEAFVRCEEWPDGRLSTRRYVPRPTGRRVRDVQVGRTADLVLGAMRLALRAVAFATFKSAGRPT